MSVSLNFRLCTRNMKISRISRRLCLLLNITWRNSSMISMISCTPTSCLRSSATCPVKSGSKKPISSTRNLAGSRNSCPKSKNSKPLYFRPKRKSSSSKRKSRIDRPPGICMKKESANFNLKFNKHQLSIHKTKSTKKRSDPTKTPINSLKMKSRHKSIRGSL